MVYPLEANQMKQPDAPDTALLKRALPLIQQLRQQLRAELTHWESTEYAAGIHNRLNQCGDLETDIKEWLYS